jgi:replicative DNA helicase
MQNEVIKTALHHPEIMNDVISSGFLSGRELEKLMRVNEEYFKNKKMPSPEVVKGIFSFDLGEENETDRELVYQTLHEFNVERYIDEVQNLLYESATELSIEKIHAVEKKYLKTYGRKTENSFLISSPEDVKLLRESLAQKEELFLETGFPTINNLTKGNRLENSGGWHPGAIYTILGLSGYGKSILLSNFARDIWEQNHNVLYISTEMDQAETFDRILKSKYKVNNIDEVVLKMDSSTFPSSKIKVIKVHPNDTTCDDVQKLIDDLDWQPNILFIDYADELKSHESTHNEYEAQGVVYAGLKKLAEVNNFPVLTATQTNRGAEDGEKGGTKDYVGYNSVADSSKKIRLVDMLFAITQSSKEKTEGVINLFILKNRFGESQKKISFSINYQTMRIEEIPEKVRNLSVKVKTSNTEKSIRELTPAEKFLLEQEDE